MKPLLISVVLCWCRWADACD